MTTVTTAAQRYRPQSPAMRRRALGCFRCADADRVLPVDRGPRLGLGLPLGRVLREPDFPEGRDGARDDPPREPTLRELTPFREAVPARDPVPARGAGEEGRRAAVALFFLVGTEDLPTGFLAADFLLVLTACQRTGSQS
ncbi:hypothetical protein LTI14_09900 [Nesterenkonia sp. YGD6]|uniref:hypothetical protein n=1 Tax=Nesterenkonia sp. YGD6 TaxID=2901231 RepID=UPI001F4D318A|nr:hypothetical protein [Nesterenkonia sp. YGD6]MCH8563521.1 hypothetical protein [Nesterenkonia sp. YGD6]